MSAPGRGLVVALALCACTDEPSAEVCEPRRCVTAPPPICQGTIKVVFQALGDCSEDPTGVAVCSYPVAQQQDCAELDDKICQSGQCVTKPVVKCLDVVCDQRPAPDCDGLVARIYRPDGSCNPDVGPNGTCEYPLEATLDCSLSGFACRDGGCVDPTEHPCEPSPCDVPPQGTCNGNTPSAPAPIGTCTEVTVDNRPVAQCAYPSTVGQACVGPKSSCYVGLCARDLVTPDAAGELVITEIAKNPASQGDEAEWFELHNPSDDAARLDGCVLSDDGGESHAISGELILPARGFVVLGSSLEPAPNGGFVPDYRYSDLVLANGRDELVITCGGVVIDRVAWSEGWPSLTGRSMSLGSEPASAVSNDNVAAWCDAPLRYGDGTNLGSPRRANPRCP